MKIKSIQFAGHCAGCERSTEEVRGGVQMMLSEGSLEEWICLSCATKLAQKLQEAVAACRWHMKRGEIYRDERWQKGERST